MPLKLLYGNRINTTPLTKGKINEGVSISNGAFHPYLDLLNRVATNRISEILLGVLKPTVESGGFLGKQQEEIFNLSIKHARKNPVTYDCRKTLQNMKNN